MNQLREGKEGKEVAETGGVLEWKSVKRRKIMEDEGMGIKEGKGRKRRRGRKEKGEMKMFLSQVASSNAVTCGFESR